MLGAAARVQGLSVDMWTKAFERDKTLVELWAMRGSPVVIPEEDLPYFTVGLCPIDEAGVLDGIVGGMDLLIATAGISAMQLLDRLCERALEVLDGHVLTKREFGEALVPAIPKQLRERLGAAGSGGGINPLIFLTLSAARLISLRGIFVMAPREGGREPSFVRTDQWLGRTQRSVDAAEAQAELVRRFLRAFAPATAQDLAWWANPQSSPAARKADEAHAAEIWRLVADEVTGVERPTGAGAFALTSDLDRLADPPQLAGVRLIPPYDPLLMARDRENLVARQHHGRLWRSTHNPGVVLANGRLIAAWTARKHGRRLNITIEPLDGAIDRATRDAIEEEAMLIGALRECAGVTLDVETTGGGGV
jgi:hypothetical protein